MKPHAHPQRDLPKHQRRSILSPFTGNMPKQVSNRKARRLEKAQEKKVLQPPTR